MRRLFLYILICLLLYQVYRDLAQEAESGLDGSKSKLPEMIETMLKNKWLYDQNGFITLMRPNKSEVEGAGTSPRHHKLFFVEKQTLCSNDTKENGMFFDIDVCVPYGGECADGMSICYKSELQETEVHKQYKIIGRSVADCQDPTIGLGYHGLHIQMDKDGYAKISSSIDTTTYTFKTPIESVSQNRCFKIKVGNRQSIATMFTDFEDEPIADVQPNAPADWDESWLDSGWADKQHRFHIFALDFLPQMDEWRNEYGYYFKKFVYSWPENDCGMVIKFRGRNLHQCVRQYIYTGVTCPGPYFSTRDFPNKTKAECLNATSGRMHACDYTISAFSQRKLSQITKDVSSVGYVDEGEKLFNLDIFKNNLNTEILSYLGVPGLRNHYEEMWHKDRSDDFSLEQADEQLKSQKTENKSTLWVSEGCLVIMDELYIICDGMRFKTGYYYHTSDPYERLFPKDGSEEFKQTW